MSNEKVYTAKQASVLLNLHKFTIVRWCKLGIITAFKVGVGPRAEWRIKHDDLMSVVSEHPRKAA